MAPPVRAPPRPRSGGSRRVWSTTDDEDEYNPSLPPRDPLGGTALNNVIEKQRELCRKYGAVWFASPEHLKVGIASNVRSGIKPLNGLRHQPEGDTTGWYIWAGEEFSTADDFFEPLCVVHLAQCCPEALRFLGLPPGWRFLTAGDRVDVWEDPKLLFD
jgi:hypothetical protein